MVDLPLHQFDYIFAISILFAFLDAWSIGANDVANSFATSVSSRSLTLLQACLIATVMEFAGAVLVGSRVAETIRSKIISTKYFEAEPTMLMLGMMCALIASSTWVTAATRLGFPVSTTHSIIGGVIGAGIALIGADAISWGWDNKGVAQVIAAWFIAPAIAGGFAAIIFLITEHGVLRRKHPLHMGLLMIPIYFGITSGILTMLIVWKGAPSLKLDSWTDAQTLGCIFGVAGGVILICFFFFIPYLYRKLEKEDWTLKWYHIFWGPMLLRRGEVPPVPEDHVVDVVPDYYRGHKTAEELAASSMPVHDDVEDVSGVSPEGKSSADDAAAAAAGNGEGSTGQDKEAGSGTDNGNGNGNVTKPPVKPPYTNNFDGYWYHKPRDGKWFHPVNLPYTIVKALMHGVDKDVIFEQSKKTFLSGDLEKVHARAPHFENKTEHLYSFLQVLTAATASFAHGSNDVANAMGPLSTIYYVWSNNDLKTSLSVPIWVLVFGGAAIDVGLWTYGYNIMRNLGNRITLHSPSRGFSMELGAALTVVLATRLALPISTTQCISGATVAVGICTGNLKAINWRMVAWIYFGWLLTLPITGIISGCLMGIIINAPRWGMAL